MRDDGGASDPAEMDLEKSTDIAHSTKSHEASRRQSPAPSPFVTPAPASEAKFGEALWKREFQDAVLALQEVLEKGFELSQSTGAWLAFYPLGASPEGFALEMSGDNVTSREYYSRAYANQNNLPHRTQDAVLALQEVLEKGFELSQSTGAWLAFWLGFALEMSGDNVTSREYYSRAYANQNNLPHRTPRTEGSSTVLNEQVESVQRQMRIGHPHPPSVAPPKTIVADLDPLHSVGTVPQMEEAVRCLGQYLGLESIRPDKEFGTGPDVLWIGESGIAVCIELKTDKDEGALYWKRDVSQLHDHIQWVKDNRDVSEIVPVFVGPMSPVHRDANPTADMVVMELQQFSKLAEKLITAFEDASEGVLPLELGSRLHEIMTNRDLLFPDVFNSLDKATLTELRM